MVLTVHTYTDLTLSPGLLCNGRHLVLSHNSTVTEHSTLVPPTNYRPIFNTHLPDFSSKAEKQHAAVSSVGMQSSVRWL